MFSPGLPSPGATVVFTYLLLWLLSASFKPRSDVFGNKLIPESFTFQNYLTVWQKAPLALWIGNTWLKVWNSWLR
ncbi:ABC-type glycerol-3-phosphate transport system permease component [Arthrobacter sp. CAN_A212]|nr:ABC-type glycerol-3-phosphate transport system permease component [Arthrobacter sp. CAN_C5]